MQRIADNFFIELEDVWECGETLKSWLLECFTWRCRKRSRKLPYENQVVYTPVKIGGWNFGGSKKRWGQQYGLVEKEDHWPKRLVRSLCLLKDADKMERNTLVIHYQWIKRSSKGVGFSNKPWEVVDEWDVVGILDGKRFVSPIWAKILSRWGYSYENECEHMNLVIWIILKTVWNENYFCPQWYIRS